ncbi:MAG: molybdate ABC transporter permease subunit [Flavobacteriales bacterium]|nr:molybdate ABC transporter permease subunit [Flavobacteriales bacterium]
MDGTTLWLTAKLAFLTTGILLVLCIPLAYAMHLWKSRWRVIPETLVSLPLVLPPTVLGFYLLIAFSPASALGSWLNETVGIHMAFSFEGLLLASVIYSLPFMFQPVYAGFNQLDPSQRESALLMGKSEWTILKRVLLPAIRPSLITASVLTWAHTLGEFGVVLMVGGNIPGETRVISIAIFDEVEALNYSVAHGYSAVLLGVSFLILLGVYLFNHQQHRRRLI